MAVPPATILVITDQAATCDRLQELLRSDAAGRYAFRWCPDRAGAAQALSTQPYALVLLHDRLLGLDEPAWATDLLAGRCPLVLLGDRSGDIASRLADAGAVAYLQQTGLSAAVLEHTLHAAQTTTAAQQDAALPLKADLPPARSGDLLNAPVLHPVEDALRIVEAQYQTLVEQLPAIIYTADADAGSSTHYVSPQIKDILGFSPEEWLADPQLWLQQIHPDDRERVLSDVVSSHGSTTVHSAEYRALRADGEIVWLRDSAKMVRDAAGRPLFLQGLTLDITDRKRADEALRVSETRLKRAQALAHLGNWEWDLATDMLHWSEEAGRILGLPLAQTSGAVPTLFAQVHPADQALVAALHARPGALHDVDVRIVRPDGALRWVNLQAEVVCDAAQQPVQMVGTVLDITERKRTEVELSESRERLVGIVTSAMDAVITTDGEQRIVLFNPAAEHMFGYARADILGQPLVKLLPERFRGAHGSHVQSFARTGQTSRAMGALGTISGLRANGVEFPIEASISQVEVGGHRLFTVILRDITAIQQAEAALLQSQEELKNANGALEVRVAERTRELVEAKEEAERANAAKSDFLSRMSHELRTPLNAILGFAQIMELEGLAGKQADRLSNVITAGQHLLRLINEVLDLARVEAGRLEIVPEPVAVAQLVRQAVGLVQPLAAQRSQTILVDSADIGELYVYADAQRLVQVLLNLLSNAAKYSFAGDNLRIRSERRGPQAVRLSVIDGGPGIPREQQARLFRPFEQLRVPGDVVEGTGLGLALSKRLIELMGGSIGVESSPGQGSCFWLDLTAAAPAQPAHEREQPRASTADLLQATHIVMYIEDNLANLQVIEHVLADLPRVRLVSAVQGLLGFDLAREHRPSLILLDLQLPDIQGDEVLRRLKADPATRRIPVVMLSAEASPQRIQQLLDAGATAYLTKPLDIRRFLELTTRILNGAELAVANEREPA